MGEENVMMIEIVPLMREGKSARRRRMRIDINAKDSV